MLGAEECNHHSFYRQEHWIQKSRDSLLESPGEAAADSGVRLVFCLLALPYLVQPTKNSATLNQTMLKEEDSCLNQFALESRWY